MSALVFLNIKCSCCYNKTSKKEMFVTTKYLKFQKNKNFIILIRVLRQY